MLSVFIAQPAVCQLEEKRLKGSMAEYDVLHQDSVVMEDGKYRGHLFVEASVPCDMDAFLFNLYSLNLLQLFGRRPLPSAPR